MAVGKGLGESADFVQIKIGGGSCLNSFQHQLKQFVGKPGIVAEGPRAVIQFCSFGMGFNLSTPIGLHGRSVCHGYHLCFLYV